MKAKIHHKDIVNKNILSKKITILTNRQTTRIIMNIKMHIRYK